MSFAGVTLSGMDLHSGLQQLILDLVNKSTMHVGAALPKHQHIGGSWAVHARRS